MPSIVTNTSARTALLNIRNIDSEMEKTQNRIATGYRVSSAADDSGYWSIASSMRSENKVLSTVNDGLGLGAAMVDVTYTAMDASIGIVDEIKNKMLAALEPGVDRNKLQLDIDQLQEQIISIAKSASFSGENWLYHELGKNTPSQKSIVGSVNRDASGNLKMTTLNVDTEFTSLVKLGFGGPVATSGNGILSNIRTNIDYTDSSGATATGTAAGGVIDFDLTAMTTDQLLLQIQATELASIELIDAAAGMGALKNRIDMQTEFVANLMESIDAGIGRLVDADMNKESTRLKALQAQEQLGIQALSIANSSSQSFLTLFR